MENNEIKIIFFGTPEFAVPAFRFLIENGYRIIATVTAPDKPAGRARKLTSPPLKTAALERGIVVFQPSSLKNNPEFLENLRELNPDICVIAAYGKIIPKDYLEIPKYGFVNIHPSLLPKYRGPAPIQTAILNGEKETGVSIMLMDEEIDHGPVINQLKSNISKLKTFKEISQELAELGAKLLIETMPDYISGKIKPQPQNHSAATFTKMFSREDGKINWNKTAEQICSQIRALNPEPGTWTTWRNKIINIGKAEVSDDNQDDSPPGTVKTAGGKIAVKTSELYLLVESLQLEGGKMTDAASFLNGHPNFSGSRLE